MRLSIARCLVALALPLLLAAGCSSPPPAPPPPERPAIDPAAFSADRAWAHLEALAAIGPRAVGTPGAAKARVYITDELRRFGLDVDVWPSKATLDDGETLELANVETTLRGESSDLIVLAAPYDSAYQTSFEYLGVNDGASGAALLLEVARVLADDAPLPYTVRLLFLDGEAPLGRGSEDDAAARHLGSVAAASRMQAAGDLARVRLLLFVNRVSDADLRIARDRFSHRTYRDAIWRTAAELGHADVFPPGSEFESPVAGHRAFGDLGMRRTVALVDPHLGGDELPDAGEFSEDDTLARSSPASLGVVGEVVLASLEDISRWLQKIDRFSDAPPPPEPAPKAKPAAEPPPEAAP